MRIPRKRNGIPSQPITHLWERQKEIARRLVAGHCQIDIARDFSMTPGRMSIICNSPIFKQYLASLSIRREEKACDISERIKFGATLGANLLVEVLEGKHEAHISLKANIAKDLLDREGHGKVSKIIGEVTHHLTANRIEELKATRRERLAGITFSPTIDVEAVAVAG